MDIVGLFFRLDGRINRQTFWLGFVVAAGLIALADMATRNTAGWIQLVLWLVLGYPLIAVMVKRLHDRGRTGWWTLGLALPFILGPLAGLAWRLVGAGETSIAQAMSVGLSLGAVLVAALVIYELGLREGDAGYSRHGPPAQR